MYEVHPEDLSAISVARKIGLPAQKVFKTSLTQAAPQQARAMQPTFSRWFQVTQNLISRS